MSLPNEKEFREKVSRMREAQRAYFKSGVGTKDKQYFLRRSVALEKEVDFMLTAWGVDEEQYSLFGSEQTDNTINR